MQDHRKNGITEIDTTNRQRIVSIGAVSQFLSVSGIYNVESVVAKTKASGVPRPNRNWLGFSASGKTSSTCGQTI